MNNIIMSEQEITVEMLRGIELVRDLQAKLVIMESRASQFESTITETIRVRDEVMEKLNVAKEALKFYANEMNYTVDDYRGISGEMITRCVLYKDCEERNDVYSYAGKIAREALEKIK